MTPEFSFCITTKNDAKVLRRSLDSFLPQVPEGSEVVVIDGGSTDGSYQILQEYAAAGKLTLYQERCKMSRGWQLAFEKSTGRLAVFQIDTDNVLLPKLREYLELYKAKYEGKILVTRPVPVMVAPRWAVQKIGGWKDLWAAEDYDFYQRARAAGLLVELKDYPMVDHYVRRPYPRGWKGLVRRWRLFWAYEQKSIPVVLSWKSWPLWTLVHLTFKVSRAKKI